MPVAGLSARDFAAWFMGATRSSDPVMLWAMPDHFDLRWGSGGQEVIETTGGSPFATAFTVD